MSGRGAGSIVKQALRFLIGGGLNTLVTLVIYWLFLLIVPYQAAYALSYIAGVCISYAVNVRYVFRADHSRRKFFTFPLVYLVGYVVGAATLDLCARVIGIDVRVAPVIAALVSVPVTFLLAKLVLENKPTTSSGA